MNIKFWAEINGLASIWPIFVKVNSQKAKMPKWLFVIIVYFVNEGYKAATGSETFVFSVSVSLERVSNFKKWRQIFLKKPCE